ncbi:MAG: isocitrate lyase/phosphoenolpyruvate mutase family protein [Rhodospirillaceae bacterium]
MLAHCRLIAGATDLPVNADTESCYAETPDGVAENIRRIAATGVAGCSIEDVDVYGDSPIYPIDVAAERVAAAVKAVRGLGRPFVLTARAENYLHGNPDLDDTIKRLQAYQDAGADCLDAPGPKARDDIAALVGAVDRPVNVIAGLPGMTLGVP